MELVGVERQGSLWRVTLSRPEKANALTRAMLHRLHEIFLAAASDGALRALTITGSGERAFCGGADLSELSRDPEDPKDAIWDVMAEALASLPVLTLALINGACIGGGMSLALGCDIRASVPQAIFAYPVLRNGLLPGRQDSARLHALIGPGRSSLLLLGGARIDADEAAGWGLVDRVVERPLLSRTAGELLETALEAEPLHLATLKKRCRRGV